MRYIICKKLHRKNARRKEELRLCRTEEKYAISSFEMYVKGQGNLDKYDYELLTGDWRHVAFYTKDKGLVVGPLLEMRYLKPIDKYKGSGEILKLFYGMSESMQKAVKEIMLVTQVSEEERRSK